MLYFLYIKIKADIQKMTFFKKGDKCFIEIQLLKGNYFWSFF